MFIQPDQQLDQVWNNMIHELHRGIIEKKHPFKYVTLATVDDQAKPNVRYVVFRKMSQNNSLFIYTDSRTEKVQALEANAEVSLLFYHPSKRIQIRINGKVVLHHKNTTAQSFWKGVPENGRFSYNSIKSPGSKILNPEEAYNWPKPLSSEYFLVIEVKPEAFEILQLNRNEHIRAQFLKINNWEGQWIVP